MSRRYTVASILYALLLGLVLWPAPMGWLLAQLPRFTALWLVLVVGLGFGVVVALLIADRNNPRERLSLWTSLFNIFSGLIFALTLYLDIKQFYDVRMDRSMSAAAQLRFLLFIAPTCSLLLLSGAWGWLDWRKRQAVPGDAPSAG